MNKVLKNKSGFTLVELIVVMAVLAVISAIAVPRYLGIQEDAKLEADYATGAMLGKAAELYLVGDGNTVDDLNTDAEDSPITLQTTLKTTNIKFVSKNLIEKEDSIEFIEEDSGEVKVKAEKTEGESVSEIQLYPRLETTSTTEE